MLAALLRYRGSITAELFRQAHATCRALVLGAFSMLPNPLARILIYTIVFSQLMGMRLPALNSPFGYAVYM